MKETRTCKCVRAADGTWHVSEIADLFDRRGGKIELPVDEGLSLGEFQAQQTRDGWKQIDQVTLRRHIETAQEIMLTWQREVSEPEAPTAVPPIRRRSAKS